MLMKKILQTVFKLRRQLIHSIAKDYIGKEASPLDRVDDVVACVESVTEILKKAGAFPTIETGTYTMYMKLARSRHWVLVDNPEPGDIIISPTGMSNKRTKMRGHIGITGVNNIIMSNDSYTGLWSATYSIKMWRDRYEKEGGYPVHFFRYIG